MSLYKIVVHGVCVGWGGWGSEIFIRRLYGLVMLTYSVGDKVSDSGAIWVRFLNSQVNLASSVHFEDIGVCTVRRCNVMQSAIKTSTQGGVLKGVNITIIGAFCNEDLKRNFSLA